MQLPIVTACSYTHAVGRSLALRDRFPNRAVGISDADACCLQRY